MTGSQVVVTRPREYAEEASQALLQAGARVILAPTVEIHPPEDLARLDRFLNQVDRYDWVVWTSRPGLWSTARRLKTIEMTEAVWDRVQVAVIGESTANEFELIWGRRPDLIAQTSRAEGLLISLREAILDHDSRILLLQADRARPILADGLLQMAQVDQVTAYRNVDVAELPEGVDLAISNEQIDWVTLTSPAIAGRFFDLLSAAARSQVGRSCRVAAISSVTAETAQSLGWPVAVVPEKPSWASLVQAMLAHHNLARKG